MVNNNNNNNDDYGTAGIAGKKMQVDEAKTRSKDSTSKLAPQ